MKDRLPAPDVHVPDNREGVRFKLIEHRLKWLGALSNTRSDGWETLARVRQERSNLDHLLDHYPSGTPRDWIVMYPERAHTPDNVVTGVE